MRNIKIVADSSCDLFGLSGTAFAVAPMRIVTAEQEFIDDEALVREGCCGGKISIGHCQNEAAAERLRELSLARFPNAEIEIHRFRGLCSFYAEKGGVLVGFEKKQRRSV